MTKDVAEALLADMRRKYLHAKECEDGMRAGDWLKGEPITARILENWIPRVEAIVTALSMNEQQRSIAENFAAYIVGEHPGIAQDDDHNVSDFMIEFGEKPPVEPPAIHSMDPADYDCCDEHETTFPRGAPCPQCEAESGERHGG